MPLGGTVFSVACTSARLVVVKPPPRFAKINQLDNGATCGVNNVFGSV